MMFVGGSLPNGQLYDAIKALSPVSFWACRSLSGVVPDEGSVANQATYQGTPTASITGPDGHTYPRLRSTSSEWLLTDNEEYAGRFTTGMSIIFMYQPTALGNNDMVRKRKPSSTDDDWRAQTTTIGNIYTEVDQTGSTALARTRTTTATPLSVGTWHHHMYFFASGTTTNPRIRINGSITAGETTSGAASMGNTGTGRIEIGKAGGYYALVATFMGDIQGAGGMNSIIAAAQAELWIP